MSSCVMRARKITHSSWKGWTVLLRGTSYLVKIDRQWVRKEYHIPFQLIPPLHAHYHIYICIQLFYNYIIYNTHTHTCACVYVYVFFFVHRSNSKGVRCKGAVNRFTMWHHVAPCGTMWHHVAPCGTMPCGTKVWCSDGTLLCLAATAAGRLQGR